MCMLSYIPANVDVILEDLLNGGLMNPHGSGWAIASKNGILMDKSMKIDEALDTFDKARKKHPDCPAIFHSRWATHGTSGIANVHPFLVGGSHDTVVAHNGILPCKPDKDDWRSDTRILADEYIGAKGKYRRFDKKTVVEALEGYIGKGNKLAVLTVDPKYKKDHYLFNEDMGNWDTLSGVWHSNYDYLGYAKKYSSKKTTGRTYYSRNKDGVYVPTTSYSYANGYCHYCGYGIVGKAGYCIECGTCEECSEFRKDCECWDNLYPHAPRTVNDYKDFDWNQKTIGRKAIESKTKCDEALDKIAKFTAEDEARAG